MPVNPIESDIALKFIVMPLLSVQLLMVVLVYFIVVRKRISTLYRWYFCFIATVIYFLIGRTIQTFVEHEIASFILYSRVALLFALGMPSLLVASALHTGWKKSYWLYIPPYILGAVFALGYVLYLDVLKERQLLVSPQMAEKLLSFAPLHHYDFQQLAILCLSVLPCSYFLIKSLVNFQNIKDVVVLFGALIFGVIFAIGSYWGELHWIYYVGSIVPALCWAWVVFHDINDMKGKVNSLKDELYNLVQSGQQLLETDVDKLLNEIEQLSSNNVNIYKMRLKEILSRLTDSTIEAGGDSERLLSRFSEQEKVLTSAQDASELRKMARDEVVGLSQIISEIPNQRIESVKQYLTEHYQEDIDINRLAEKFTVSRSYLMREFKKATDQTVNQFLTTRRIEVAKKLLLTQSVTDTAFAIGFNNSNYFSTVFKKMTGQTPVQYQQSSVPT
ncbi:helix-turn-helix transcriptional regulator [Thalassotalea agariperforans]